MLQPNELASLNKRFATAPPEDILIWAQQTFAPDLSLACSFGGPSGMVLLDMVAQLTIQLEVFYLDTELLFPETYALRDEVARRYGITPVAYRSLMSVDQQADRHGQALWLTDPDRCCYYRKVEPNVRALAGKRAWISGIRRDQSSTRASVEHIEWDDTFGLVKINPLALWSEAEVWSHIREHDVPCSELHERGYASVGCMPCTRPIKPGEDARAGRWSGTAKLECGLHLKHAG